MYCAFCDHAPCVCDPEEAALVKEKLYPCPCGCGNYANGQPMTGYIPFPCIYDTPDRRHLTNLMRGLPDEPWVVDGRRAVPAGAGREPG